MDHSIIAGKIFFLLLAIQCTLCPASAGDRDPQYRDCLESCQKTGCVDDVCFSPCNFTQSKPDEEEFYLKITRWDCPSECRYQCMNKRESQRALVGEQPVKYHGKWPFQRLYGAQEPASVLFSVLNMLAHVYGLSSFLVLVYSKLPQGRKGPCYEFVGLFTIYGLLNVNTWFWSAVFHIRDTPYTESWDYSSAIATIGFSFLLAIIRTLTIRNEATRVMVSAPTIGFIATHICYLNFYEFDYGWNTIVCSVMGVLQLLFWLIWATVKWRPSSWKVWAVALGSLGAMALEIFDFPPLQGKFDAHSLWHLATVPLTLLWWSFVKDDAKFRTALLTQRVKKSE